MAPDGRRRYQVRAIARFRRYPRPMLGKLAALLSCAFLAAACTATPPPGWAKGGAPLVIPDAIWRTPDGTRIEIRHDGTVLENGGTILVLDRVGRVYDEGRRPLALLFPQGELAGTDHASLGRIGLTNAAPPGSTAAWLSVLPDGGVLYFDPDGQRFTAGAWRGCNGPPLRTCTLVTHLVALRRHAAATQPGTVYMGFGIGIYR